MTRRRVRLDWLAGLIVVAAAVAVAVAATTGSSGGSPPIAPSPDPAAGMFARAYLRYLDGDLAAAQLPDASARARAQAGAPIGVAQRAGTLRLHQLQLQTVAGAPVARVAFTGRDVRGRIVGVQTTMAYTGGRWHTVSVIAPDLVTALRSRSLGQAHAPGAAQAAAASFALAYIDYAEGARRRPPAAQSAVAHQIAAGQDPLNNITPTHRPARLQRVLLGRPSGGMATVTVQFSDGGSAQTFAFLLAGSGSRWHVSYLIPNSLGVRP